MPISQDPSAPSGGRTSTGGSTSGGSSAPSGSGGGGGTVLASGGGSAFVVNTVQLTGPGSGATRYQSTGMFTVTRQTADRCEFGPPVDVPVGAVVSVAPIPSNTVSVGVSIGAGFEAAKGGPRILLAPAGNPRTVKVRNLREIGVYSANVGEGVTIDIQEG